MNCYSLKSKALLCEIASRLWKSILTVLLRKMNTTCLLLGGLPNQGHVRQRGSGVATGCVGDIKEFLGVSGQVELDDLAIGARRPTRLFGSSASKQDLL